MWRSVGIVFCLYNDWSTANEEKKTLTLINTDSVTINFRKSCSHATYMYVCVIWLLNSWSLASWKCGKIFKPVLLQPLCSLFYFLDAAVLLVRICPPNHFYGYCRQVIVCFISVGLGFNYTDTVDCVWFKFPNAATLEIWQGCDRVLWTTCAACQGVITVGNLW